MMKRLMMLLILSSAAFGQGVSFQGPKIESQVPQPIAGLTVVVCLDTSLGTPCTPTVSVFSDKALTVPITLTTDGDGMFPTFFIAPGQYQWCASDTLGRISAYCTKFTAPAGPNSSPTFVNLTVTGNESVGGILTVGEVANAFSICAFTDSLGLTDQSALFQSCFNLAYPKGETVIIPKGKFLINTAQNWTNKPGYMVAGLSSQYQISSQSPIGGDGESILLGNTGGVLLDTTGSGDGHISNLSIYLAGTGIATPSTVGILQGRDNAGGGGSSNPFCFASKFEYSNVNIVDYTNNTSGRGLIGIYNVGAENGIYRNLGIHAGTPIVLAATNIASITSPFQTLQTGCPNSMTGVHMDSVITDSFTAATPNIEASGTFSNWLTNHQFIGGNAAILFEGSAAASNWDVTGEQESAIATSYFIRSTVGVNDSRFHVEGLPATAMINPEANSLTYQNNDFSFNADNTTVPLITNTATGTAIKGGRAVVSGTTSASNTTVTATDIYAPGVTDGNIAFNAASAYTYKGTSGLITHGTLKATQLLATSNGTLAAPALGITSNSGLLMSSNTIMQFTYGGTASAGFTAGQFINPVAMVDCWSSNADPNNAACDTGASRIAAGVVGAGTGAAGSVAGEFRSAKISATYSAAGTVQTGVHIVQDTCTLGTSCAITLAGSAVFTSSSSFHCSATDMTAAAAVKVVQASGSSVTFTGTGTDVLSYICIGN